MYVGKIVREEAGYKDTSVSKKATVKDHSLNYVLLHNKIATEQQQVQKTCHTQVCRM